MVEKVLLNSKNIATFKCPECKKSWKKDLSKLDDRFKIGRIKCKCPCGFSFPVILDYRRYPRKTTQLTGAFIHDKTKRRGLIYVKNISKSGIGFELSSDQFMHAGDRLSLKFNLDDAEKSFLYKEVMIKKITGKYVGVEFCEFRHKDGLALYLEDA